MELTPQHFIAPSNGDYELIDSGEEFKLERFGEIVLNRPDPQALWLKGMDEKEWRNANAAFHHDKDRGVWNKKGVMPERWEVDLGGGIKVWAKLSAFKHVGIFPEHAANWEFIRQQIQNAGRPIKVLNLFGYTGIASLVAAQAGAEVCHVDGSKVAVTWARDNAILSGLDKKPVRWIVEDVPTFVQREIKRGNRYDAIIMDPPAFGHGPDKELWKIEDDFLPLMKACSEILTPNPLFAILNGYAAGYSSLVYLYNLQEMMKGKQGSFEHGELLIKESSQRGNFLPCGIAARWKSV